MHPRETGRLYDAIAVRWDAHRRESSHGVAYLESAIALCRSHDQALDVGCGSGGPLIDTMLLAGFKVTGLDVSKGMLDIAKSRHPAIELVHDDIVEWVPNKQFDLVLAWDSIFHLPYDAHAPVIRKLCSCLAGNGVLLFTAGGTDAEIAGDMLGYNFFYSSLSDTSLLGLVQRGGCTPMFMERDQYPLEHLVVMAAKAGQGND